MKYLFVHQNFPGQYLHILKSLVAEGNNQIVFITAPNENQVQGVTKIEYQIKESKIDGYSPVTGELDLAFRRSAGINTIGGMLKKEGFTPDIIIGHHGWGEMLNIQDVWPNIPILGYYEFFYHTQGLDVGFDPEFILEDGHHQQVRARNTVNLLALSGPSYGQTPTHFQLNTYPQWAREKIALISEGVDLEICKPNPELANKTFEIEGLNISPATKLVTFVSRSLEPYRGFHVFMRSLGKLLEARSDIKVAIVGAEGTSYGPQLANQSWKDFFVNEQLGKYDQSRVYFLGRVSYKDHIALLQRSNAHVYLTYPFVASWSLREALACGTPIIGSDTQPVKEFILENETGLIVPFFDQNRLVESIVSLLENKKLAKRLSKNARAYAVKNLDLQNYLANYRNLIEKIRLKHDI